VKRPTDRPSKVLTWYDLKIAGNEKEIHMDEVAVRATDMQKFIDFAPYINTGVYSIPINFFLKDAYTFFRTMALTHLIVVNSKNHLVGVITRKDLLGDNILLKRKRQQKQIKNKIRRAIGKSREKSKSVNDG